jgi:hypothetical protein
MMRRFIRSKFFNNVDTTDFLTINSIYLNKSLLYYQTNNINSSDYYKSILEKRTLKIKTYDYLTQHSYSSDHSSSFTKLGSIELARQFVHSLTLEERNTIKDQIFEAEKQLTSDTNKVVPKPSFRQLSVVCLQCGLPFIGFGFVDNFLMIVAGDLIESWIGTFIPISTMAAAGFGNAFSDVAGIGIAHHIEAVSLKFVKAPQLTSEQWELRSVSWIMAISKSICIFIGCVIGMAPLLFINNKESDKDKKSGEKEK